MERTPAGTPVGVDDPYEHAGRCDHCTDSGRCRWAVERADRDPGFATERRADDLRCPAADPEGEWAWRDCPHYRSTTADRECVRCGLSERRDAHSGDRPLLEEHHLVYPGDPTGDAETEAEAGTDDGAREPDHEITVALCRWCHARVHGSWARITDDAAPDPEALAALEGRRSTEQRELGFETAAQRRGDEDDGDDGDSAP